MKGLIFTYFLAYGGSVAALFNPFLGLLAFICLSLIQPASLWHWAVQGGEGYARLVAICMLIGWALHGFGRWQFNKSFGIMMAFVGFWVWSILSGLNAMNSEVSWAFVENIS